MSDPIHDHAACPACGKGAELRAALETVKRLTEELSSLGAVDLGFDATIGEVPTGRSANDVTAWVDYDPLFAVYWGSMKLLRHTVKDLRRA